MEAALNKRELISVLTRSPHGDLKQYVPIGRRAATEETDFFAHLVIWNQLKGEIRDAKVALPVLALTQEHLKSEYRENALASIMRLSARDMIRAIEFAKEVGIPSNRKHLRIAVERWLKERESNYAKWERTALQHRDSLCRLYRMYRAKPSAIVDQILFKKDYPKGSVFAVVKELGNMSPLEAAGEIVERKIPFLVAASALGPKGKDPDLVMAIIKRMTPTELVTNMKRLEKLGVKTNPALRAALEEALGKASKSQKNILKTTVAAEAIEDDVLKNKMRILQEKQIEKHGGIEGSWLVLADKSGSMQHSIDVARRVAAAITAFVKGTVTLVFFDTDAYAMEVTGKSYEAIADRTKNVVAGGGTAMGIGLAAAAKRKIEIDGIAVISDGANHQSPSLPDAYKTYVKAMDKEPALYFYRVKGEPDNLSAACQMVGLEIQVFDVDPGTDYYAIPNLVSTMRINPYSLVQEIMDTELLTLDEVLPRTARKEVEAHA